MNEENEEKINTGKPVKLNFFQKVWCSITKIETYPEMAAQGLGKANTYLTKIVAILTLVLCLGIIYQTNQAVREGVHYLENKFPEFSYKEGNLNVESDKPITIAEDKFVIGKIIVDTKIESEEEINKYINEVAQSGNGVIILKDKIILKNDAVAGTINYNYKEMLSQMGITEFTKQDIINYANSAKIVNLYISIFLTVFIYSFIMYFLTTVTNALLLSVFGYLTTWVAKIKMRYVAIFNMSVYALTLSVILDMIYITVNVFIDFNMKYFQVMYVAVAAIYLVAAIFLLKLEFIKKQGELQKIVEAGEVLKQQLEEKKKEKEEKKKQEEQTENKEVKKENKEQEKEKKEQKENKEVKKETKKKTTKKSENNDEDKKDKSEEKEAKPETRKRTKKENNEGNDTSVPEEPDGANA